ncbi:hypothetical protein FH972_022752 [Carpinus fangiana]|uniref:HTH CENPB-type domain-containing protein n=1 Tax=Carpinus fangiana TaxID=176857 RepID=A0A5N6KTH2_9ROSI|nr:hypothetical protein FH972_022752 [Carpinus fangiana]
MKSIPPRSRLKSEVSRNSRNFTSASTKTDPNLELFGVERSTVSKVLRQKEKYLASDPATLDGSRSPIKRHKPKLPDLDRTLAKWAQNQQQRGLPLTDDLIRNQARTFRAAAGGGSSKDQSEIESDSWLEKFKQKNNIGTRGPASGSKKSSPAIAEATLADATLQSPPTSIPMAATASQESTHGFHAPHRTPHHSQSNTSLSSAFNNDTGTANTNTNSPLFSPEVAAHNSTTSYFGGPENRRRSHTVSGQTDTYLSPPHTTPSSIASPGSMHHAMQPPGTLLPPSHYSYPQVGPPPGPFSSPTIADARIGLGNALTFLSRSGPESGVVGGEDFSTLQRVYERLMAARGPGEGDDRGDRLASITEHQQMV